MISLTTYMFSEIINGVVTEKQVNIIHIDPFHNPDNVYSFKHCIVVLMPRPPVRSNSANTGERFQTVLFSMNIWLHSQTVSVGSSQRTYRAAGQRVTDRKSVV